MDPVSFVIQTLESLLLVIFMAPESNINLTKSYKVCHNTI